MATKLKKGDRVEWRSSGGTATGKVVKKLTSDTSIKDHEVKASKDDPQYLVESDNGGKAAHKPSALKKTEKAEKAGATSSKKGGSKKKGSKKGGSKKKGSKKKGSKKKGSKKKG